MKEFNKSLLSFAPSTSPAKNDALISEIRDQISRSQNAFMWEKDDEIRNLRQQVSQIERQHHQHLSEKDRVHQQQLHEQLTAKDREFREQLDLKEQQLALERADHQKTRNSLHRVNMENKDNIKKS